MNVYAEILDKRATARPFAVLGFFFLVMCLTGPVRGQFVTHKFDKFGVDQGISNQIVTCVLRDRGGFLWVGTENGLNRFDGYSFKHFLANPGDSRSLRDGSITTLFEDGRGNLWVGTKEGGLHLFDRRTETFRAFQRDSANPASLSHNRVYRLFEDTKGRLWVGTAGGMDKVVRNDADPADIRFSSIRNEPNNPESLSHNRVTSFAEDSFGTLWVGTKLGLNRMVSDNPPRFVRFFQNPDAPEGLPDHEIYCLLADSTGDLWIGAWGHGGLFKIAKDELSKPNPKFVRFPFDERRGTGFSADTVFDLIEDGAGNLWFCAGANGLRCLPREERIRPTPTFSSFESDAGNPFALSAGTTLSLCVDRQGLIWIANSDGGLNKHDPEKSAFRLFRHHPGTSPSVPEGDVTQVAESPDGSIWITGEGLTRIMPGITPFAQPTYTYFKANPKDPKSLPTDEVSTLLLDSKGRLWIGTINGGLNLLQKPGGEPVFRRWTKDPRNPDRLGNNVVLALLEDSRGTIWVGTYQGLYKMVESGPNQSEVKFVGYRSKADDPSTLGSDIVESLVEATDGQIWVGTSFGVNRLNPETGVVTRFMPDPKNPNGLGSGSINALLVSSKGVVWIGTQAGLCRFDAASQTVVRVGEETGLASLGIQSLAEDALGRLWVGTINGLFCLNPESGASLHFGKNDGMPHELFSRGAAARGNAGTLYFGTAAGLIVFRPEAVAANAFVPPVVLTELLSANRVQPIRDGSMLPAALSFLDGLVLGRADNLVSIEFSALNFQQPENNRYAYKLEGLYDDWIETDAGHRRATFTNLKPGEYLFRVKACNDDGLWNERGVHLRIVVPPPWWLTWWAKTFYALAVAGSLFGAFRFQTKRVEARALLQEAQLRAKAAEAEKREAEARAQAAEREAGLAAKLAEQNKELTEKNEALVASQQQADRIFSALAEALPGTVLDDKYRLDEKIGAGGFGVVFKGTHLTLDRPIAVKVFKPSPGNDSPDAVERFKREGISTSRLSHPNVVTVLDSNVSKDGVAYMVMELLRGHALSRELKGFKRLPLRRAADIVVAVCRALAEAHRHGIIHRDIKPDNIFLNRTADGEVVKVVDFGIAKMIGADAGELADRLTKTGAMIGTPAYFSPERIKGVGDEVKSDVYSVGVMFYEMLAGCSPFRTAQANVVNLMMAHMFETPPPLRMINPEVTRALEEVVMKALVKDPKDRPSAEEFADMVAAVAAGLPAVEVRADTDEYLSLETADTVAGLTAPKGGTSSHPPHGANAEAVPTGFQAMETAFIKPDSGQVVGETAALEISLQETTQVPVGRPRSTSETDREDVEAVTTDFADEETGVIVRNQK